MTRTKYHESLDVLKTDILDMGTLTHDAISSSIKALKKLDHGLAESVVEGDKTINDYEMKIENSISQIVARQSPTAGDMRLVISCLKIAIDLERMSDLAVDIAEVAEEIEGEHVKPLEDIPKMVENTNIMLQQAMIAFSNNDAHLAELTAKKDDEIDSAFYSIEKELIEMMLKDNSLISNASKLLFVLRYIERMADHACNICESIVYIAEGQRERLN